MLGSLAVIAVYSAGYARTKMAAARFDEEDARRRPPMRSDGPAIAATTTTPVNATPASPPSVVESRAETKPSTARDSVKPRAAATSARAATKEQPVADSSVAGSTSVPVDSSPVTAPAIVAAPPPATAPTTGTPASADTAVHPVDHAPQWRDGVYSGWGTSRHGDIQAAVEIKEGRITSAFITQCLTRYSCSWISALPPQVVSRQSAEVDYVSGATQSTNAFYYAILEALNKAK